MYSQIATEKRDSFIEDEENNKGESKSATKESNKNEDK